MLAPCTPLKFRSVSLLLLWLIKASLSILTDDVSLIRSEVEGWSWDEGETDIDHPEKRERIRCLSGVGGRHEL